MLQVIRELHAAEELSEAQQLLLLETKSKEELYDLENDPHEIHNLAAAPEQRETLDRLRALLDEWIVDTEVSSVN